MSLPLPQHLKDLIDKKAFAHLATVMSDGSPQVSPVWLDTEGDFIRVNSAQGRIKDRNMRRNPSVALSLTDPENPYQFMLVRGRVVDITEQGADDHIDSLAFKYLGQEKYPYRAADEVRVLYKIELDRITGG